MIEWENNARETMKFGELDSAKTQISPELIPKNELIYSQ